MGSDCISYCSLLIFLLPDKNKFCTLGSFVEFYPNAFNIIYPCLEKSFCSNLMNSKLKSVARQRNTPHLKGLGVTLQKLQNDQ